MCIWDRRMLLMTALVAAVLTAISDQLVAAEIPKVGILYLGSKGTTLSVDALIKAMEGFGYQDGKTVTFEYRYAEGEIDLLPALAKELVDENVTVIVAIAGESLVAAAKTTTTVPIVSASAGGDFVAMGLAKSWESPGGNVTGMNLVADDAGMARVEILKKLLPNLTKLAVLANKTYPGNEHLFSVIEATAKKLNVTVQAFDVSKPEDLEGAIASAKRDGVDAVLTLQGPFFFIHKKLLAELAQKHKIPLAMGEALSAEAGVMLQVNPDIPACAARSASFVDRILKGVKPGDLGIERFNQYQVVFNLKTAKELGISVDPDISKAAKVIQ